MVMASAAIVIEQFRGRRQRFPPPSATLSASASVVGVVMPDVESSHEAQIASGRLVLTATDDTATCVPPDPQEAEASGDGWRVSLQASPLVYSGARVRTALPASVLAVASVAPVPVHIAGLSAVDSTNGPKVPEISPVGTLDSPRIILTANPGYGCGT